MKNINNSVLIITYIIMADNLCMNSNVYIRVSWTFKFMSCVIYMYFNLYVCIYLFRTTQDSLTLTELSWGRKGLWTDFQ